MVCNVRQADNYRKAGSDIINAKWKSLRGKLRDTITLTFRICYEQYEEI